MICLAENYVGPLSADSFGSSLLRPLLFLHHPLPSTAPHAIGVVLPVPHIRCKYEKVKSNRISLIFSRSFLARYQPAHCFALSAWYSHHLSRSSLLELFVRKHDDVMITKSQYRRLHQLHSYRVPLHQQIPQPALFTSHETRPQRAELPRHGTYHLVPVPMGP